MFSPSHLPLLNLRIVESAPIVYLQDMLSRLLPVVQQAPRGAIGLPVSKRSTKQQYHSNSATMAAVNAGSAKLIFYDSGALMHCCTRKQLLQLISATAHL